MQRQLFISTSFFSTVMLMALIASGCRPSDDPYLVQSRMDSPIHPTLRPYVNDFVRANPQDYTPEIKMTIGKLEAGVAGKCYLPGDKPVGDKISDAVFGANANYDRRIVISESFIKKHEGNYFAVQQVVFHELGHCLLSRGHTEGKVDLNGEAVPKSIMFPAAFGNQLYYQSLHGYYKRELFDNAVTRPGAGTPTPVALTDLDDEIGESIVTGTIFTCKH